MMIILVKSKMHAYFSIHRRRQANIFSSNYPSFYKQQTYFVSSFCNIPFLNASKFFKNIISTAANFITLLMLVAMTLQPFEVMPSLCCLSDTAFRRRSKTSYFLQKKNIAPHFITIFLHRITRIELLVAFLSGKSFLYLNFLWTKANSLHFERTVAKSRKIPPTHFQPMHHPRLSRFRQAG